MSDSAIYPYPEHWELTTLGQLCLESGGSIQTGPFGSQLHASDYVDAGIPSIMPKNISIEGISTQDIARITDDDARRLSKYLVEDGDIVYSRRGDVEKCALVTKREAGWLCGTGCLKVSLGRNSRVTPSYIHAYLSSPSIREWISRHAIGATMPNLNTSILSAVPVLIPSAREINVIENLWRSTTDKIILNRQTNQTLEQIAQAIFKSWFVDFEPTRAKIAAKQAGQDPERAAMAAISGLPITDAAGDVQESTNVASAGSAGATAPSNQLDHLTPEQQTQLKTTAALFPDALIDSELGEIPEGWNIAKLGDLLEFNPTRTLKKGTMAPYLDMKNVPTQGHLADDVYLREMASGTKFINGDTLLARITPCLENGKTAYVDFLEEGQVAWGSTEYIVMRPKNGRPMSLGYMIARLDFFRSKAIQTMTGTSGRQRANAKALSEQKWINYPPLLLNAFDQIAGTYLAQAKKNGDENKTLSAMRDALLPQLMSGDLPVSNKEIA